MSFLKFETKAFDPFDTSAAIIPQVSAPESVKHTCFLIMVQLTGAMFHSNGTGHAKVFFDAIVTFSIAWAHHHPLVY